MTTRDTPPRGAPTWVDLFTSDVVTARRFYGELFGWEATDPIPEFGGYFNFSRDGVFVAGSMGDMPGMPANNKWQVYLATDNIEKTLSAARAAGAQVISPPMAVADLGVQAIITDPTGAGLGVWQPGNFPGFTVLNEPGTPSWFELHTREQVKALDFYRSTFGWDISAVSDTDEFRYAVMRDPTGSGELAGIMDSTAFMGEGESAHWDVYWHVDDIGHAVDRVTKLDGSVLVGPDDTPYGQLAVVADPMGAQFKLRVPPRG